MAGTVLPHSSTTVKERQTRRSHTKVKSGCLTCKIRRKKCDETRPACIRCTSTGRKCDGYDSGSAVVRSSEATRPVRPGNRTIHGPLLLEQTDSLQLSSCSLERAPETVLRPLPSIVRSELRSDIHLQCFDYFRHVTGPQFGSYFDSTFWVKFISSAALSDPVILKAAAAVGAVHRRYNLGITPEAFQFCEIAARLKKEAVRSFAELSRSATSQIHGAVDKSEVLMTASLLFGLFEVFQDNCETAVQHIIYALKQLWNRPMILVHSESQQRKTELSPELFHQLFFKLHSRATQLFGRPPHILTPFQIEELPPIPDAFTSLSDALDSIFTQAEWILHAPAHLMLDPPSRQRARQTHVSRILAWSAAYAETISTLPSRTSTERQACHLLCLTRNTIYLVLYIVFFTQPDVPTPILTLTPSSNSTLGPEQISKPNPQPRNHDQDSLSTNLTRLLLQAESVLDTSSPFALPSDHTLSLGSGIGPPRLPTPGPASSSKTRHLVSSLLSSSPPPSSTLDFEAGARSDSGNNKNNDDADTKRAYPIAELLNSIEEHAVLAAAAKIVPPLSSLAGAGAEAGAVQWIDLTCFLEEGRVLLRYCRPAMEGTGLVWTREWWKFCR